MIKSLFVRASFKNSALKIYRKMNLHSKSRGQSLHKNTASLITRSGTFFIAYFHAELENVEEKQSASLKTYAIMQKNINSESVLY